MKQFERKRRQEMINQDMKTVLIPLVENKVLQSRIKNQEKNQVDLFKLVSMYNYSIFAGNI